MACDAAVLPIFLFSTLPTCGILVTGEDGFSPCFDGEKALQALTEKGFVWYTSVNWVGYTHMVGKASERRRFGIWLKNIGSITMPGLQQH